MTVESQALLDSLAETEARLERANESADLAFFEEVLSEDFRYTSGVGADQTKQDWIANLPNRRIGEKAAADLADVRARAAGLNRGYLLLLTGWRVGEENGYEAELHGDVAITNRRYAIVNPDNSERCLRYVRIYRFDGGHWRLLSHRYIHAVD